MRILPVTDGISQIEIMPRQTINAYLIGSVLVDAGIRTAAAGLLKLLAGLPLTAHVLTHAHADHQGASAAICAARRIPFWCGAADREAAETGNVVRAFPNPRSPIARLQQRLLAGPGYPVTRVLSEGDLVEGFVVLETPGHSPGHLGFWREHDRVLIAGDCLNNMNLVTTAPGLHEPPAAFTTNQQQNRASIRKLAALRPDIICFGHGPVLRNASPVLDQLVAMKLHP